MELEPCTQVGTDPSYSSDGLTGQYTLVSELAFFCPSRSGAQRTQKLSPPPPPPNLPVEAQGYRRFLLFKHGEGV